MAARDAINLLHQRLGSWRAVADDIGTCTAAYWCAVAGGKPLSRGAEDALRFRLRLPPKNANGRIERFQLGVLARYLAERRKIGA